MMPHDYGRWRGAFAAALDPRFHTVEYLDSLVWYGRARLFANDRAALLAEIKPYPTGACDVHVLVGTGELDALVALEPQLAAWGREHRCLGVLIESREGWAKVMKKYGYKPHQIAVRKNLEPYRL
jgi:hypothetical protein